MHVVEARLRVFTPQPEKFEVPLSLLLKDILVGTAGTTLETHAPDVGGAWTPDPGYAGRATLDGSGGLLFGSGYALYKNGATTSAYPIDIYFDVFAHDGTPTECGIVAHATPGIDNGCATRFITDPYGNRSVESIDLSSSPPATLGHFALSSTNFVTGQMYTIHYNEASAGAITVSLIAGSASPQVLYSATPSSPLTGGVFGIRCLGPTTATSGTVMRNLVLSAGIGVTAPTMGTLTVSTVNGVDTINYPAPTAGTNPIAGVALFAGPTSGGEASTAVLMNTGSAAGSFSYPSGNFFYTARAIDAASPANDSAPSNEVQGGVASSTVSGSGPTLAQISSLIDAKNAVLLSSINSLAPTLLGSISTLLDSKFAAFLSAIQGSTIPLPANLTQVFGSAQAAQNFHDEELAQTVPTSVFTSIGQAVAPLVVTALGTTVPPTPTAGSPLATLNAASVSAASAATNATAAATAATTAAGSASTAATNATTAATQATAAAAAAASNAGKLFTLDQISGAVATTLATKPVGSVSGSVGSVANQSGVSLGSGSVLSIPAPTSSVFYAQLTGALSPTSGAYVAPGSVIFQSGTLATQRRAILTYQVSGQVVIFTMATPFTASPDLGDMFLVF